MAAGQATTTLHSEIVRTTSNHPWLSADHGWLIASFLRVGESVQQADGSVATVERVQSVPGAADMWDLTVSALHDFAVGNGAYVVHNNFCKFGSDDDKINYDNIIRKHGMNSTKADKSIFALEDDDIKDVTNKAWENRKSLRSPTIDPATGNYTRPWRGSAIDRSGRSWIIDGIYNESTRVVEGAWPNFQLMFPR